MQLCVGLSVPAWSPKKPLITDPQSPSSFNSNCLEKAGAEINYKHEEKDEINAFLPYKGADIIITFLESVQPVIFWRTDSGVSEISGEVTELESK